MSTRWYYIDQLVMLVESPEGLPILVFRNGQASQKHCAEVAKRCGFDLDSKRDGYWTLRSNGCELL